jgi:hypothetical protein
MLLRGLSVLGHLGQQSPTPSRMELDTRMSIQALEADRREHEVRLAAQRKECQARLTVLRREVVQQMAETKVGQAWLKRLWPW